VTKLNQQLFNFVVTGMSNLLVFRKWICKIFDDYSYNKSTTWNRGRFIDCVITVQEISWQKQQNSRLF